MKPPDDAPVNPIDRDLVDAFAALDRTVPEGALDDFAARVAARLDAPETADSPAAGLAASSPPAREDSGLHDIKALASSARRRASEREQSESDVGESYLLTAAQGGLRAVALPEAGKSEPGRRERGPGTRADARSSAPFWILGGVASLAAVAAVAVFVFGLGRDQDGAALPEETNEVVARVDPPPPANGIVAPPPETVSPDTSGPAERLEAKATDAPVEPSPQPRARERRDTDEKPKPERAKVEREARTDAADAKAKEEPRAGDVPTAEELGLEGAPAPVGGVPGGKGEKEEGAGGDVELGDMLDEVAGKKPPAPPPPPPDAEEEKKKEPEKKELDRRAVTRALEEVRGAVEKCHEVERFTGVVTVKFAVAPGGQVSSAAATGAHARSRTGSCVADAVKQARFDPFEGSPISFTLPFRIPGGE